MSFYLFQFQATEAHPNAIFYNSFCYILISDYDDSLFHYNAHTQVNKRCRFLLDFEKEVTRQVGELKLQDHPFGGADVDASSLGWAMSAVSSRAFRLHGKALQNGNRGDVPMMLPLIDMCNHSFNPNAEIVQEQSSSDPKMLVKVCLLL